MSASDCVDPTHFYVDADGAICPQPWMQWRQVASTLAATKAGYYNVTGGPNKNDLLHNLQLGWTNATPIDQWVYGLITRGGARVTLQARSRGYLQLSSGYKVAPGDPGPLTVSSRFGVGADMGRGGALATGTTFCVIEERQQSTTFPVAPERPGWTRLTPGQTFTAAAQLSFLSEFWENTTIDGGPAGSESSLETGATRLDLFALPVI